MSAHVQNIYNCPRCKESITASQRPEVCPACDYEFGDGNAVTYKYPMTMHEQFLKFQDQLDLSESIMSMPIEKANNMMLDALNIIELIPAKNVAVTDIRALVKSAIKIGQIAQKYEDYLLAGGIHVPDLFQTKNEKGTSNDTKKKGARVELA